VKLKLPVGVYQEPPFINKNWLSEREIVIKFLCKERDRIMVTLEHYRAELQHHEAELARVQKAYDNSRY
jgi:hypothetical protein